ncbi:MAG: L-histidine N(alpha)-methyltransferase [Deltaproteobacteria bacterium]|nr:L-histidine N(alpha)-methyltransferase [Deltaproteobacteria bacterium]MDZ4345687.1 L-histidine N(alpha)-methyltransferase [Candidatus Binatia bacterium]
MKQESLPRIFAAEQRSRWRYDAPGIWSLEGADLDSVPIFSILTTLWDQPRWLEAYHLYDERGSELFEEICHLPEYYLTRTENGILESHAADIIAAAPVECVVELGAGYSKKTVHLLTEQNRRRGRSIFAPIDVSRSALLASQRAVQRDFPEIDFHGLHARYEEGFNAIEKSLPTLFVFLGSTIGNFNHTDFPRFFRALAAAMGPNDFLLLGADRVKPANLLEDAYNDSRGVTAEFILNVFRNINHRLHSNFDLDKMRYHSWYNPEWQQIEMFAVATGSQEIRFPGVGASFHWRQDEKILVEISRKFEPLRLQEQLRFFDLEPVTHCTDPDQWFSVLLFKKRA